MTENTKWGLIWMAFIALVGLAMWVDKPAPAPTTYCQQVHAGNWPDFRHTYKSECKLGPARPFTPYGER